MVNTQKIQEKLNKLNEQGKDTEQDYKIMILKLEGRVRGVEPEDLNMLIDHQGQSNARLIVQELKNLMK